MIRFKYFLLVLVIFGKCYGITYSLTQNCSILTDLDDLPDDKFITYLTDPCRYDKNVRPNLTTPFEVKVKMELTHLEATQTQISAYVTMHLMYKDEKLNFETLSPKRSVILGDESLKEQIWTPNVLMIDTNDTSIIQVDVKDIKVSIDKTGQVVYSYKSVAKFYCWMKLQKFPFDSQKCSVTFTEWTYSNANLNLSWHEASPLILADNLHFTEFIVDEVEYSKGKNSGPYSTKNNILYTSFDDGFSELSITLKFHRDVGFYLLDFFVPSYLLVFTAWVTFWLQADAGPPRATLGASTIVAFITLHLGVSKDLPKVSYVKASDVWFLGVMCFIFLSLAEFAFVNVIWRRKKKVELKKDKDKYIIKGAFLPKKARKDLRKHESTLSIITTSASDISSNKFDNSFDGNYKSMDISNADSTVSIPDGENNQQFNWKTMTPQEVAIYVDRKARIVFPIAFLIFNILYWVFVYCL